MNKVCRIYFDDSNRGRIIAVAQDGTEFEQTFERCTGCHGLAMVMKPLAVDGQSSKHCCCTTNQNTH